LNAISPPLFAESRIDFARFSYPVFPRLSTHHGWTLFSVNAIVGVTLGVTAAGLEMA
jgi:hypothetical protein